MSADDVNEQRRFRCTRGGEQYEGEPFDWEEGAEACVAGPGPCTTIEVLPTPEVPKVLEDLPDLETVPPRPPPNIFECPRGHRQIGSHADFLTNRRPGFPDVNSGAQCIQCKLEWFGEVFPTFDTGVQYVPEPRTKDD